MKSVFFLVVFVASFLISQSQLVSGPMLGDVQQRTAKIWIEVKPQTKVTCLVWEKGNMNALQKVLLTTTNSYDFETVLINAVGLKYNTTYEYQLFYTVKGPLKPSKADGSFTTRNTWAYRTKVPEVSFLTGSCSYSADTAYDRIYSDMIKLDKLAKPYGGDQSIFTTMANTPADLMLWLGDNWYTREADYNSEWGLHYRASYERSQKILQPLFKAMPQYATWDDHDFGPNDCDKSYIFSNESRNVFKKYWANPTYGDGEKGIYTKFNLGDVDFFLLDDRTWRSNDNMSDSIDGQPNMEKRMFGYQQLEWLKNALIQSQANFKIIVTGSQVLNPVSPFDAFRKFPAEYLEFLEFIKIEKVNGILFFTGDRHHTEIIKVDRPGSYPLHDITVSPLTSGTHTFGGVEKNNPYRVLGIDEKQNFGKVTVTGPLNDRKLNISFLGINGEKLGEWSINAKELRGK
jgi:alkaline phosphatase D